MGWISQTWAGIQKEILVYRNHKKFLINDYLSVFLWTLLALYFSKTDIKL